MVRRGRSFRRIACLSGHPGEHARRAKYAGDGAVVPRRMVSIGWRRLGQCSFRIENLGVLSRKHRVSFFQLLAEGEEKSESTEGICLRDWRESVATGRCVAS